MEHTHNELWDQEKQEMGAQSQDEQLKVPDFAEQPTMALPLPQGSSPLFYEHINDLLKQPAAGKSRRQILEEQLAYAQLDEQLEEDLDFSRMSTLHLMQLSGMMRAVKLAPAAPSRPGGAGSAASVNNVEWWSNVRETGMLPVVSKMKTVSMPAVPATPVAPKAEPTWKKLLGMPAVRIALGCIFGAIMLFLVFRSINIPKTISILRASLTTPQGLLFACLAALSCVASYAIRGARWRFFVSRVGKVKTLKAIQIFLVGVFINFALPVQGGEVAKSLMLKRIAGIPISQSLPTVAMDKALDLMPALIIMAIVPFIGVSMNATLWIILGTVGGILLGLIFVVALTAWNRGRALKLIQLVLKVLPKGIGGKIEGFAMGLVDSLLAAASNPRTFIPAILLTCLAVTCDGLFALFSFWTIGLSKMSFGAAIFGYTTYNMFTILPSPPGGVGSNEFYGGLVFSNLLGFNRDSVTAMFLFSHPLFAIVMTITALICLRTMGLTIASALRVQSSSEASGSGAAKAEEAMSSRV
ncbi:lysylphosphatidylglycerol synthase transmembrane domain-containing protein [Ktedonosporobacter rubrisoli]|nr:lysylphosphatidylglycerol synthase transmembrane domain-containing protein [Ktedonosporobacter rubrisoli]